MFVALMVWVLLGLLSRGAVVAATLAVDAEGTMPALHYEHRASYTVLAFASLHSHTHLWVEVVLPVGGLAD